MRLLNVPALYAIVSFMRCCAKGLTQQNAKVVTKMCSANMLERASGGSQWHASWH